MKKESSRRSFLAHSGLLAGAGWFALHGGAIASAAHHAAEASALEKPWTNISAADATRLGAVADQVYPPLDGEPGAEAMGAVRFMDAAFGGFMAGPLPMVLAGLDDLDQRAHRFGSPSFRALDFDDQTTLVGEIETTPFFGITHMLTLCGVFALPAYGGNQDQLGWKAIGFENRHVWQPPFGEYDASA